MLSRRDGPFRKGDTVNAAQSGVEVYPRFLKSPQELQLWATMRGSCIDFTTWLQSIGSVTDPDRTASATPAMIIAHADAGRFA